ncbi:hypothetical protein CVT26_012463 [Gymnopilus dilepis]|uniref:Uncharacterized protein n=1 Tax=Gymnopilus dilepis TaxID=231916 RepID=A0A409YCU5_9AGAR|nr:hypothetical protein CVT26_012463 [Gymnopilus dilepis]
MFEVKLLDGRYMYSKTVVDAIVITETDNGWLNASNAALNGDRVIPAERANEGVDGMKYGRYQEESNPEEENEQMRINDG